QGDCRAALPLYEESLAMRRQLGDRLGIAASLHLLGNIALEERDLATAGSLYQEGLAIRSELGDRWGIAGLLEQLAALACEAEGERSDDEPGGARGAEVAAAGPPAGARRAARLFGAAEALREAIGTAIASLKQEEYRRQLSRVRARLGEEAL